MYLDSMTVRLSKENVDLVLLAINSIAESEREDGEAALPTLGRVLREMRTVNEPNHPHVHLRMLVRKMAKAWKIEADEELLQAFVDVAGHRTDSDLTTAYNSLMRSSTARRLCTPGEFLSACGVMTERRDGGAV